MNEVERMKSTLQRRTVAPTRGTVQEIRNGQLVVRSSKGAIITVSAGDGTYGVGDRVVMSSGIVVEKITTGTGKTVYLV